VTPSGVIFKETPEGVTTNIRMIYVLQSSYGMKRLEIRIHPRMTLAGLFVSEGKHKSRVNERR
jgi:hypothetical protein